MEQFKCLACKHEYKANPGPTQCPKCKHLLIEWVSYEEKEKAKEAESKNSSTATNDSSQV